MTGKKNDAGKPDLTLLDRTALEEIAKVMMFGATKYDRNNWRKGISQNRLCAAALRHLYAHADGETYDDESGLLHLAHAGCCIMFAINMLLTKKELDDRINDEGQAILREAGIMEAQNYDHNNSY